MADINTLTQNVVEREKGKLDISVEEYRQKVDEEISNEKKKLDQEFAIKKDKLEQEKSRLLDIALNSIQLKKRDDILAVKQEIIGQYIEDVQGALENLDPEQTQELIRGVIDEIGNTEGLVLQLGEKTIDKVVGFQDELGQKGIQLSNEIIHDKAGFVISKGPHQYNYLFDNIIDDFSTKLQQLLLDRLFQS